MISRISTAITTIVVFATSVLASCAQHADVPPPSSKPSTAAMNESTLDTATLAGGCFWCIEAVFQRLDGVTKVESGYTGGAVKNPTYKEVCNGTTGHAEVCNVTYDPSKVSFEDILYVFFSAHDPTTLNKQGNDVGTQYRSAIFYHNDKQKETAAAYIAQLESSKTWPDPIVTEVSAFSVFYKAEDYHQDYYNQNGSQPYCAFVVRPKVEKFMQKFSNRVKEGYK